MFANRRFCDRTCKGLAQRVSYEDRPPAKECVGCGRDLPLEEFGTPQRKRGPRSRCRACYAEYQRPYEEARRRPKEVLAGQARERRAKLKREDFFAYRARQWGLRGSGVTSDELHALWLTQDGRCALTGRELTPDAHLDHKMPRCRGGETTLGNLQWLCEEANRAQARLTDEEFVALCRDVVARADL